MSINEESSVEKRRFARHETSQVTVDYRSTENFLFSYIQNISEMGIFIRTDDPLPLGTELELRFGGDLVNGGGSLELRGVVTWTNPVRAAGENLNPGMGVRFSELTATQREAVVGLVRTVAYLQTDEKTLN